MNNNFILDNEYYRLLVGGQSKNDPISVLVDDAPAWTVVAEPFGPKAFTLSNSSQPKLIMVRIVHRYFVILLLSILFQNIIIF